MKTPNEKYYNDPQYHQLVDMLESFIHVGKYPPSELREAATYACIRYELKRMPQTVVLPDDMRECIEKCTPSPRGDNASLEGPDEG